MGFIIISSCISIWVNVGGLVYCHASFCKAEYVLSFIIFVIHFWWYCVRLECRLHFTNRLYGPRAIVSILKARSCVPDFMTCLAAFTHLVRLIYQCHLLNFHLGWCSFVIDLLFTYVIRARSQLTEFLILHVVFEQAGWESESKFEWRPYFFTLALLLARTYLFFFNINFLAIFS